MDRFASWLNLRHEAGTLRRLRPADHLGGGRLQLHDEPTSGILWDFSSNDYLGLSEHPALQAASQECLARYGTGAGAARLMSGDFPIHHQLEEEVARLKGKPAALLFGSGYLANVGAIPALVGRGDVIFADRLNHASIYDGCRLAGARLCRFHHNDLDHLETLLQKHRGTGQALIVVESLYSMDGDICPLAELVALKERFDCLLMVDEAHATGVFGAGGGGLIEEAGVVSAVDIAMGTFGKALGSYGAYVAAEQPLVSYLLNRARAAIYSTALPPAVIGASLAAMKVVENEPGLRADLLQRVAVFKEALRRAGLGNDFGPSQIVPVQVGESTRAMELAAQLQGLGRFVVPVRPPTVPEGTARLRFSITRHLPEAVLEETAVLLADVLRD